MKSKNVMLNNLDAVEMLLERTKDELGLARTDSYGRVTTSCNGDYSLNKVKRNCIIMRELLLEVKKGCELGDEFEF